MSSAGSVAARAWEMASFPTPGKPLRKITFPVGILLLYHATDIACSE